MVGRRAARADAARPRSIRNSSVDQRGIAGNLRRDFIDYRIAVLVTVFELCGVLLGVRLAHKLSALVLRRLAAVLCILVGSLLLARSL